MADINLQKIHDDLVAIAYEAGAMIMAANPNSISTDTKLNCKTTTALSFTDQTMRRHGLTFIFPPQLSIS